MSITIGRIENLFWSNSGHKFPNGFPDYDEKKELNNETPNMNDIMSGTIYLEGENWNHCFYDGTYYFLHQVFSASHRKARFLYRLERDWWMDILRLRPKVVGDLANSNNDKLLEANLNRTFSILDNPARVVTINFGNIDFDWTQAFTFKESTKELRQIVLSKDNYFRFIAELNGSFRNKWKFINDWLYQRKNQYIKEGSNDATFIISYLEPSFTTKGWKNLVRDRINEFVRNIVKNKEELKLSKINTAGFANSPLNGSYCITHKVNGISTTQENVVLSQIDLSGLTDIVPIEVATLKEKEAASSKAVLGEGNKSGLFEIVSSKVRQGAFLAKIRRKMYIPYNLNTDYPDSNWKKVKSPQRVSWAWGGKEGALNLWFLDNVNFILQYNNSPPYDQSHGASIGLTIILAAVAAVWEQLRSAVINKAYFKFPTPWVDWYTPFTELKKNPIVPFGFLIYGIRKRFREWRLFEYISKETRRSISYFSGIKASLLNKYSEEVKGQWWSVLEPKLAAIQPTLEFTKFYLDNYLFSWLSFVPSTSAPFHQNSYIGKEDTYGTGRHTKNASYIYQIINRDLHNYEGQWARHNPFNDFRIDAHMAVVDNNIGTLFNFTELELPEGRILQNGDYLFSDQDYEILEYPGSDEGARLWAMADAVERGIHGEVSELEKLLPNPLLVEDALEIPGSKPFADGADDKYVVMCTTRDGDVEIRTLENFEKELSLSRNEDEIVKEVEGSTKRRTRFTHMRKMHAEMEEIKSQLTKIVDARRTVKTIEAFYKLYGYKTYDVPNQENRQIRWVWFDEDDFSENSNEQLLFDLVGTDWYAFFAKGKVSLIAKKPSLFGTQKGQAGKLLHEENKDLELSLIEKINQKVRFQFFSVPFYLNWRSSFTNKDRINIHVEALKPVETQTSFDQYFVKLDTEFDHVYYENISLGKKQTKALNPADSFQLERLNLDLAKSQYAYQIDSDRLAIAQDRYKEAMRRAEVDLYHQRLESFMSLGTKVGAGAFGSALAWRHGKGKTTVTTLKRGHAMVDLPFSTPTEFTEEGGAGIPVPAKIKVPYEHKKITHKAGKQPLILGAAVAAGLKMAGNLVMEHAFKFPEQERRIGFEKQIGASELALQSLQIDTSFMERQVQAQLSLNQATNMYSNPIINEREIMETFMDKDEWHGKKLKPAHLICFVPSEEQLVALRSFKEEYGVMCDIPDIEMTFYEGMEPDVVRFRNLDDASIKGLPNNAMRGFLLSHLHAGIKIVKTTKETFVLLTPDDYEDKIFRLNANLLAKSEEVDAKDKQIVILTQEKASVEDKVKAECAQEASKLQNRIKEIEDQVNHVNEELRKKLEELAAKEKSLTDERQAHKEDKEEMEQKLNDERRKFLNEQDKANKLSKEKDEANKALEALKAAKATVEGELTKCKADLAAKTAAGGEVAPKLGIDCNFMIELMKEQYEYDLKARENGWDLFLDLIFEVATNLMVENRTDADQNVSDVAQMRPILQKLEELKNIPIIDKAIELTQDNGWSKYIEWLEKGGDKNGDVDRVITGFNQIKGMATAPTIHSVKALLDEVNYLIYKAKKEIGTQLDQNVFVQFFFRHIYPAKAWDRYRDLFGSEEIALIRKKYAEETKCVEAGKGIDVGQGLLNTKKDVEVNYNDVKIRLVGGERAPMGRPRPEGTPDKDWLDENEKLTPETPSAPPPTQPVAPPEEEPEEASGYRFARSLRDASYSGVKLKDVIGKLLETSFVYTQPIFWFEDANYTTKLGRKESTYYPPENFRLDTKPNITKTFQIWNWAYSRNVPQLKGSKRLIWFKWRDSSSYNDTSDKDQYGNYFLAQGDLKIATLLNAFRYLLNDSRRIIVPEQMVRDIASGAKKLRLRMCDFIGVYTAGVRNDTEIVFFGNSNNELLWPKERIKEFLQVVFALHFTYMRAKYYGQDSSNGYNVYGFEFGGLHPKKNNLVETQRWSDFLNEVNKRIAEITDSTIDLQLGTLVNHMVERMDSSGDMPLPSGVPRTNRTVAFMTLYAFILMNAWALILHRNEEETEGKPLFEEFYKHGWPIDIGKHPLHPYEAVHHALSGALTSEGLGFMTLSGLIANIKKK